MPTGIPLRSSTFFSYNERPFPVSLCFNSLLSMGRSMRRVVITGMGVVSPNGIGKEAFCAAILAGKSGVSRITRFDASSLPVQIAGQVEDFDELAWVERHERKHVSRVVPLAIAASHEAIQDAGLDPAAMS